MYTQEKYLKEEQRWNKKEQFESEKEKKKKRKNIEIIVKNNKIKEITKMNEKRKERSKISTREIIKIRKQKKKGNQR